MWARCSLHYVLCTVVPSLLEFRTVLSYTYYVGLPCVCRSFPGFRPAVPAPVWELRDGSTWLLCGVERRFRTFLLRGTTSGTSLGVYDNAVLDGSLCEAEQVPPSTGRSRSLQGVLVAMDGFLPEAYASWLSFAD